MTLLAFADTDPFGRPDLTVLHDLARRLPDVRIVTGDDVPRERPPGRLVCVGIAAGARAAIRAGRMLGADAVVAWAPTAGDPSPSVLGDSSEAEEEQAVHLISAADTAVADLALARRLAPGVRLQRTDDLPSAVLPILLRHTGALADTAAAARDGSPAASLHDLAARWRHAFAHRLTLDPAAAYTEADGTLHLPGTFHADADLADLAADHVLIGARIAHPADPPEQVGSARAAFARPRLGAGESLPFALTLPAALAKRGGRIEVGLVAERRFWFDGLGFPKASLWLDPARAAA